MRPKARPSGTAKPAMSAAFQKGKRSRRRRNHAPRRRADEAAVVREAAGPELRPGEAVALLGMADALRRVPHAVVRASTSTRPASIGQSTLRGIGAEVHVVPEVAVGEHVEDAAADDAREQHREAEVDDDVGIFADAPRPERAERGGEEEARQRRTKYDGKPTSKRRNSSGRIGSLTPRGCSVGRGRGAPEARLAGGGGTSGCGRRRVPSARARRTAARIVRHAQHLPRFDVNMSTAMSPTPTQMAMSATLNVGQWCCRRAGACPERVHGDQSAR